MLLQCFKTFLAYRIYTEIFPQFFSFLYFFLLLIFYSLWQICQAAETSYQSNY